MGVVYDWYEIVGCFIWFGGWYDWCGIVCSCLFFICINGFIDYGDCVDFNGIDFCNGLFVVGNV